MITIIPFKVLSLDEEGFHLMVKLHINRKVANLIIDTGASKTVLDKTKAEKYVLNKNFALHNRLSSGLGTNTMESQTTVLKKIKLGEIEIENYTTVLLDLSHVNSSYEQLGLGQVDGVLGSDLLLKYNAIIDYEKKILKLKYSKSKK
jgi:predicted aspartyl protease